MDHGAAWVVVLGAEGPEREGNLGEEERGDDEREVGEDVEPERGVGAVDGGAVGGEEGVGEVGEHAGGVYQDLVCVRQLSVRDHHELQGMLTREMTV